MPKFQFVFDVGRPVINFLVEPRPRIKFDFNHSVIHSCGVCGNVSSIQFFVDRRPKIQFNVGLGTKHSCGEMHLGFRFMDSLVNSALKWQILYLHGDLDDSGIGREVSVFDNDLSTELVHGSYRDIELGDWDDLKLLKIDPEIIGMKVLGKLRVHVETNYPETWLMLADQDGNVLEAAEEAILVVEE